MQHSIPLFEVEEEDETASKLVIAIIQTLHACTSHEINLIALCSGAREVQARKYAIQYQGGYRRNETL